MNQHTKTLFYAVVAAIIFALGFFTGFKVKKCPEIQSVHTETDTIYQSYPVYIDTNTKPVNKPVIQPVKSSKPTSVSVPHIAYLHDTLYLPNTATFTAADTIPYKGLFFTTADTGNCTGILNRGVKIYGEYEDRIITSNTTTTITFPDPFVSLFAGATGSFSQKWSAFDFGPAITLSLRNRYNIGYGYQFNAKTHNVTLQTKIK